VKNRTCKVLHTINKNKKTHQIKGHFINQISIFEELKESKIILLAGVGDGFDVFSGIPLYFNLKKQE